MNNLDRIRISFIGAGGICEQRHLPGLALIPDIELVTVCNRSAESSERIKQKWGFARIEADWRKVIDDPNVDAVFIGTWPYLHRELSIAALNGGKHVFCQARMSMNYAESLEMVAAALAHPQLVSMVCPSPFRVRWERTVTQILGAPAFGELQNVLVRSISNVNANPKQISWRERVEYSGLNILQVGIIAETLNAWCGECKWLKATTEIPLGVKTDEQGQPYEIEVPQRVRIMGELKSGATLDELHSGLYWPEDDSGDFAALAFFSDRQMCKVDLLGGQVTLGPAKGEGEKQIIDATGDPWQVEVEFIAAVRAARRGEPWRVSPDFPEAARYMQKMQALHDSAASGEAVTIK